MAFENILNAVWLLVGLSALAVILARSTRSRSPVLCCIGVALVIATLFPIISASDDIIRIQHLERSHGSQGQRPNSDSQKRSSDSLIRLYEAMESPLVSTPVQICFVLFFAFLTISFSNADVRQRTIGQSGRSPPLFVR